jgi:hypothetical protein
MIDSSNIRVKSDRPRKIDCGTIRVGHGGDITTDIAGFIGGKKIFDREGHSLLNGFAELLYIQMRMSTLSLDPLTVYTNFSRASASTWGNVISSATNESPVRITKATLASSASTYLQIRGATGMTELNTAKVWGKYISATVFDLYTDETETTEVNGIGWGTYDASTAKLYEIGKPDNIGNDIDMFYQPTPVVGLGTKAVEIEDIYLDNLITGLDDQGINFVDQPVVLTDNAYIQVTRDFANSSGGQIDVKEIGSTCFVESTTVNSPLVFLSRDLQTFQIPDGETLTLRLRYKTLMDQAVGAGGTGFGGITRQFLDLLYRMMKNSSFSIDDLSGTPVSALRDALTLAAAGVGGDTIWGSGSSDVDSFNSWVQGIVLGTDWGTTLPVDIDNTDLGARIGHGRTTGELVHYGTQVHSLNMDTGTDKTTFEVSRIFKNDNTSGTIRVQEVGLVLNGQDSRQHDHLVMRRIHDNAGGRPNFTDIAAGDVVEAILTVEVAV